MIAQLSEASFRWLQSWTMVSVLCACCALRSSLGQRCGVTADSPYTPFQTTSAFAGLASGSGPSSAQLLQTSNWRLYGPSDGLHDTQAPAATSHLILVLYDSSSL
jgi:hypothetical protein